MQLPADVLIITVSISLIYKFEELFCQSVEKLKQYSLNLDQIWVCTLVEKIKDLSDQGPFDKVHESHIFIPLIIRIMPP